MKLQQIDRINQSLFGAVLKFNFEACVTFFIMYRIWLLIVIKKVNIY